MFGDVNRATLLGNVTKDPELRYTPSGAAVISFSIATNRRYKKGDEWQDEVNFHNIVVWQNAESLSQRIKKGTRIYLEGRISTRSWEGQDGKKNYKTEVVADRVILIARYEGAGEGFQKEGKSTEAVTPDATTEDDTSIDPNDLPF